MNITVYCGSSFGDNPNFKAAAQELGAWIGESGNSLVYGGSCVGLMGTVSAAALEAGAETTGVELRLFAEAGVAKCDLTNLYVVDTLDERKNKMIELGDVFVALPGGVGTLEEISEIFTRVRLDLGPHECYMLNIDGFYDPLIKLLESMIEHGFFDQCDLDRCFFPTSVTEFIHLVEAQKNECHLRRDGSLLEKQRRTVGELNGSAGSSGSC